MEWFSEEYNWVLMMQTKSSYVFAMVLLSLSFSAMADANSKSLGGARPEVAAEAVAHYARSRALLVSALHEFDKGRKLARPDELIDSTKWRNTLIDRAEDLERVLDPQPRATRGGIKFEADSRLLPEAKR
jgi:hypothetical protein